MDPNKMSGGANRHYAAGREDAPPSYSEAMKDQPNPGINYRTSIAAPSAPTLESTISTNAYPKNEPPHFPQTDTSHSLAQNYQDAQKWDNRAARMLVMNRLQMQEQFDNARTDMDREVLWNLLLNQLLGYGYNFSVIDLINFWEFQFEIYKSIVKNLQSGASSAGTDWEFFEPINRVFAHYDVQSSSLADAVPSSSSTSILSNTPIPVIVPVPMPLATSESNQFLGNPEVAPASLNLASSDQVTSTLSPSGNASNGIPQVPLNERSPLLTQSYDQATNSQMNSSLTVGLASTNINNKDQEPITTQPEGFSIPKFIDENEAEAVVTRQPIAAQTMPQEATTANNRRNNDGCCGSTNTDCCLIFCFSCHDTHDDYHYHHNHTDNGCCDDGGCCDCGAGGGCCDGHGGGGGCCDGADHTGCCDDFDCDGCDEC